MINTTKLQRVVTDYNKECRKQHKRPTYKELAQELNIHSSTISNIVRGMYADGKPYTSKPHITRCINNDDFAIIRDLFM